MTRTIAALILTALSSTAYADVVSERVVLVPAGGSACGSGQQTFKRVHQRPDGTWSEDTTEFRVPTGMFLDITNIEYTMPYSSRWAKGWVQHLEVDLRPRTAAYGYRLLTVQYGNEPLLFEEDNGNYVTGGESLEPIGATNAISFTTGPLMGSQARLCVKAASNFWGKNGTVKIRGKLISTGSPVFEGPIDSTQK